MKAQINMIGIITNNFQEMKDFYNKILWFEIIFEWEKYVEFKNEGVRFALSTNDVMYETTKHNSYNDKKQGQTLEFAFLVNIPWEVDREIELLQEKWVQIITHAQDTPWWQRTAFFADPDGHIHEIFCDL